MGVLKSKRSMLQDQIVKKYRTYQLLQLGVELLDYSLLLLYGQLKRRNLRVLLIRSQSCLVIQGRCLKKEAL